MRAITGREAELSAIERFVDEVADGPSILVIEGPAGIGKTTVWEAGVARSRPAARVLVARPSIAEREIPWAGLTDLFGSVDERAFGALPGPQRRVIEIVLARREPDPGPVDELTVSLAVQSILRWMAADGPVVIAVDDLQWLDAPTLAGLLFSLRRTVDERIGLIASTRTAGGPLGPDASDADDDSTSAVLEALRDREPVRMPIGALAEASIGELLHDRLGIVIPLPMLREIVRVSAGNPLYAIELGRAAAATDVDGIEGLDGRLELPDDLRRLVEGRLARLSQEAQELAIHVAVSGRLEESAAAELLGERAAAAGIEDAHRAGLIRAHDGVLDFVHPLLGAIVYAGATDAKRRRIHERFAKRWPESPEAPRHLGLAATGEDAAVAAALDASANLARRRGAPAIAAAQYEQAARLTPAADADDVARRWIESAQAAFAAGATAHARETLERVATVPNGPRRAEALQRLASVVWAADGDRAGMEAFERALPAAAAEPAILGDIHDNLAWLTCWLGDMPRAYDHIQIARGIAEAVGDPALLARVFDKYSQIEFQIGRAPGIASAARAIEFERELGPGIGEASLDAVVILIWSDLLDEAREQLSSFLERAKADGNERLRVDCLNNLGALEMRAGNWIVAREHYRAALDGALAAGLATGAPRRGEAMLNAFAGRVAEARLVVAEFLPAARSEGLAWALVRLLWIGGFADLSEGAVDAAADALDEADRICERIGVVEPGIFRVQGDAVEALIAAGRLDRAEEVVTRFERDSKSVGRPWGLVASARGRGLLLAARGRHEEAVATLDGALEGAAKLGQSFELGRTLLAAGTIDRRAGRRREARARLEEAVRVFEDLGAELWLGKAHAELSRISGRAPGGDALTATEQRVAALVAEGLTNAEAAARLFVTVRTVETNLTRIYQKLGVRSRTELARRLAEHSTPAIATTVLAD